MSGVGIPDNLRSGNTVRVTISADDVGIGGGTQYAEGSTQATITGTAILWEDTSDVVRAVSSSKPLPVDVKNASLTIQEPLSVDDNGGSLTIDNADITTIAGAVSGGQMQVDLVAITPDLMLGSDFSNVMGTASLVTGTQADNLANTTDGLQTTTMNYWYDGSTWDRARGDSTDGLLVNLGSNNDVTIASVTPDLMLGTDFSNVFGAASLTNNSGIRVGGDEANDAADDGNPLKIGGRAQSLWAQPDEVGDDDRVDGLYDRNGYQHVRGDFDPKYADINDSTSGDNTIVAAAGAGKRIAIWAVALVSDGTVDVRFEDGAGGTAFTGQIPLQSREGFTYTAGGLVPLWVGSANTLFNLELSAAVNVHGSVSYTVIDD